MRLIAATLIGILTLVAESKSVDELVRDGVALARDGRLEEAVGVLEEGAHTYPDEPRFPLELAGVAFKLKQLSKTRSYLLRALRLEPLNRYGNEFLGAVFLLDGNVPATLKYWNRLSRPVVGEVRFVPVPKLEPVLVARLPAVSSGQVLTLRRYERTEANLGWLGVFADYGMELTPRADERYDLTIRTSSRSTGAGGRWWWKIAPYVRGLPYSQTNVDFFNLRQRATNFVSLLRWDENKRRISAAVSGPLGSARYRIAVDARDERWDLRQTGQSDVRMRRMEAGGETAFPVGEKWHWTTGLWVSARQFGNGDASPLFRGGWLAEIRNRFDGRLLEVPERRLRVDGIAQLRVGRYFAPGPTRFVSPQAGAIVQWFPQARGEKYEVVAQARTGAVFGAVPLDEMYMLGMERDNDLWLRGHVGTQDGRKGNAPEGSRFLLVNTELRRELLRIPFVRVQAGPFFDFGGARDPGGRLGSRGLLYDAGVQATVGTIGGLKITAVYGRDLRDGRPAFYTAVSR